MHSKFSTITNNAQTFSKKITTLQTAFKIVRNDQSNIKTYLSETRFMTRSI